MGSFGPYGRNVGVPFELPAFGGQIIGFHGSAGDVLDRIGVYIQVRKIIIIVIFFQYSFRQMVPNLLII